MDLAANTQRPLAENISAANFTWVVCSARLALCAFTQVDLCAQVLPLRAQVCSAQVDLSDTLLIIMVVRFVAKLF